MGLREWVPAFPKDYSASQGTHLKEQQSLTRDKAGSLKIVLFPVLFPFSDFS